MFGRYVGDAFAAFGWYLGGMLAIDWWCVGVILSLFWRCRSCCFGGVCLQYLGWDVDGRLALRWQSCGVLCVVFRWCFVRLFCIWVIFGGYWGGRLVAFGGRFGRRIRLVGGRCEWGEPKRVGAQEGLGLQGGQAEAGLERRTHVTFFLHTLEGRLVATKGQGASSDKFVVGIDVSGHRFREVPRRKGGA